MTERSYPLVEKLVVRRVVQVDVVGIGKVEFDLAQGVVCPRSLGEGVGEVDGRLAGPIHRVGIHTGLLHTTALGHHHVPARKIARVAAHNGQDMCDGDTARDIPEGIEDQMGESGAKDGRAPVGLADDDPHIEHGLPRRYCVEFEIGDPHQDIAGTRVVRQPAPTLHIQCNRRHPRGSRYIEFGQRDFI